MLRSPPVGDAILREGFRDGTGSYMVEGLTLTGVWISDIPLSEHEGAGGDNLIQITLPDDLELSHLEVVEDGKPYREWCVPASTLNHYPRWLVASDESAEIIDRRFPEQPSWNAMTVEADAGPT